MAIKHKKERLFDLTKAGIATLFGLSFVGILVGSWKNIVVVLTGASTSDVLDRPIEQALLYLLNSINDNRLTSIVITGVYWSLVGIMVYLFVWAMGNLGIAAYNSWLINTKFINRSQHRLDQLTARILRLFLVLSLPVAAILSFWLYYPWAVHRFNTLLSNFRAIELAWFVGDIIVVSAISYMIIIWLRILLGRPYVI